MKATVSEPIAGAKKTELVAAMKRGVDGTTRLDVSYLGRAQFDALKLDWAAFTAQTQANAEAELKAVKTEYVRDRNPRNATARSELDGAGLLGVHPIERTSGPERLDAMVAMDARRGLATPGRTW